MITEVLDTTTNSRVTMKMDVSYTNHSHIIGKGGNTIRRLMAETNCHIHFPDSNRSNLNEKSNQVRIFFFSLTHSVILILALSHTHILSHSLSFTLALTHTHSITHTKSLSLSITH